MYQLLRQGKIEEFNEARKNGKKCDLHGSNLRNVDLRGLNTEGLDFSNCYMRHTDLRGLNLRHCNLEGVSIHEAKISGAYFPRELSSSEIRLSWEHGTRMRYRAGT
ncbi:MAG: pentapeptide repeat-containing protein [Candidatus Cloacimonetes bacterium]|nr:pentapeptide repeat-containing protein [Candidatus Cloacimonadota bacterium]